MINIVTQIVENILLTIGLKHFANFKDGSRSAKNTVTSEGCRETVQTKEAAGPQCYGSEEGGSKSSRPCLCRL